MTFAQILAMIKKYGYHCSLIMETSRNGNMTIIGKAIRM
jgi:hypothetical protein